jgi:RAT1-interacting protein
MFWINKVWDLKPEDKDLPINWVELKTSEEIQSDADMAKFERKLLKFWIQSFLLGVPKIIVGFRSKKGTLLRLEEFATQSIPGSVKRRGNSWDGNTCVNFAASFLDCELFSLSVPGLLKIAVMRLDYTAIATF